METETRKAESQKIYKKIYKEINQKKEIKEILKSQQANFRCFLNGDSSTVLVQKIT